jgi:hypothetical protein
LDTNQNDVYLAPAEYVDSDHPAIEVFVASTVTLAMSPTEKARRFYLAAREIRYDPDLDYSDPAIASARLRCSRRSAVPPASRRASASLT